MSQDSIQQSQFVVPLRHEKHVPFYIREWETMLIGTLIVGTLIYLLCNCGADYFSDKKYVFDRRSSAQAHFGVDDRPGHDGTRTDTFRALNAVHSDRHHELFGTPGAILRGVHHTSSGPSVSKFMDFAAVDAIDHITNKEPNPIHQPATSDDDLESMIRPF